MVERMKARTGRPRNVTGLGIVLILIAVLALLSAVRGLVGYVQSADVDGIATLLSPGEFILQAPEQVLVPAGLGIIAALAAIGVFRGRPWGRAIAIGVGAACLLGGVLLTMPAIVEWGVPGSFALLLLPAAFVAYLIGGYVVYAALANRAYFSR